MIYCVLLSFYILFTSAISARWTAARPPDIRSQVKLSTISFDSPQLEIFQSHTQLNSNCLHKYTYTEYIITFRGQRPNPNPALNAPWQQQWPRYALAAIMFVESGSVSGHGMIPPRVHWPRSVADCNIRPHRSGRTGSVSPHAERGHYSLASAAAESRKKQGMSDVKKKRRSTRRNASFRCSLRVLLSITSTIDRGWRL